MNSWRTAVGFDLVGACLSKLKTNNLDCLCITFFELKLLLLSTLVFFLWAHGETIILIQVSVGASIFCIRRLGTGIVLAASGFWFHSFFENLSINTFNAEGESTLDAHSALQISRKLLLGRRYA